MTYHNIITPSGDCVVKNVGLSCHDLISIFSKMLGKLFNCQAVRISLLYGTNFQIGLCFVSKALDDLLGICCLPIIAELSYYVISYFSFMRT